MRIFFSLAVVVSAVSAFSNVRVRMEADVKKFTSSRWVFEGRATSTEVVSAIFVLKRDASVLQKFETQFHDLSSPFSPNYGKWLTKEDVIAQMAPREENVKLVLDYLSSFGLVGASVRVSDLRDKVFVSMPATLADEVLNTEFGRFRSVDDQSIALLRVLKEYSLPSDIADVVALVDDIIRFPSVRRSLLEVSKTDSSVDTKVGAAPFGSQCGVKCSTFTTPDVLAAQYNFTYPVASVAPGNQVAVAEFQYQYFDLADLNNMDSTCGITVSLSNSVFGRTCNVMEKFEIAA